MLSTALQYIYRLAGLLIAPLLPFYLKKRQRRGKEDTARLKERFGFASRARPTGSLIWMHAASVGELQSLRPLIEALQKQYTNAHLLITTGTVTSAALCKKMAFEKVIHQFVPVDSYFSVRRFLRHWQPDLALWVESEFWPELLTQTQKKDIPTMLINARLSEKSMRNWQNMRALIQPILKKFHMIIASTEQDAKRLEALGAGDIKQVANLKFEASALSFSDHALADLQAMMRGRSVLLAASTHAQEEQMLGEIALKLRQTHPELLMIIVPRHATRGEAIKAELETLGASTAMRSINEAVTSETLIYLADTMGELGLFYAACDIVFIGGSLIAHGGHNMLEPARLHGAIITGVHHFNFTDIVTKLKANHALMEASDVGALQEAFSHLLNNPDEVTRLAENAHKVANEGAGAIDMIMQSIAPLIRSKEAGHA